MIPAAYKILILSAFENGETIQENEYESNVYTSVRKDLNGDDYEFNFTKYEYVVISAADIESRIKWALNDDLDYDIRLIKDNGYDVLCLPNGEKFTSALASIGFWQFAYDIEGEITFRIAPVVMREIMTLQPVAVIFYKESK